MKRKVRLGPGKKTKARRAAIEEAKDLYFFLHGDKGTTDAAPCQYCPGTMLRADCRMHHKTPRSELRKTIRIGIDHPRYLLAVHKWCHTKIHGKGKDGFGMGRPIDPKEADEFRFVETSPVNSETGGRVRGTP